MSAPLDLQRIAKGLGAERRGKVPPRGGYFGALQLVAEVSVRFRVPERGGRAHSGRVTARRGPHLS